MPDCVFCGIVRGELPSTRVYESENVLAFKDIKPLAPVHIQVIPKRHLTSLMNVSPEDGDLLAEIMTAVRTVAREQGVADSGFRLVTNIGADSGQVVFHLHFHIMGGEPLGSMC